MLWFPTVVILCAIQTNISVRFRRSRPPRCLSACRHNVSAICRQLVGHHPQSFVGFSANLCSLIAPRCPSGCRRTTTTLTRCAMPPKGTPTSSSAAATTPSSRSGTGGGYPSHCTGNWHDSAANNFVLPLLSCVIAYLLTYTTNGCAACRANHRSGVPTGVLIGHTEGITHLDSKVQRLPKSCLSCLSIGNWFASFLARLSSAFACACCAANLQPSSKLACATGIEAVT